MIKRLRFKYEAAVLMDVTADDQKGAQIHGVELEYDHALPTNNWQDKKGNYTEQGISALLFAYCTGVTTIIHNAGQVNGMDTAALFRKAIDIMERQFAAQVTITRK